MGSHNSAGRRMPRWVPTVAAVFAVIGVGFILSGFHGARPKLGAPDSASTVSPTAAGSAAGSGPGGLGGAGGLVGRAAKVDDPAGESSTPVAPTPSSPPTPPPNHCAANTDAQRVYVSIAAQHAWMCAHSVQVAQTAVTTGATADGEATPTGTFVINSKQTDATLTVSDGSSYHVKYWLPYSGNTYGFHDASWQTFPYGSSQYHTDGSHGCVHLPLPAMRWLFDWAQVGTVVTIT